MKKQTAELRAAILLMADVMEGVRTDLEEMRESMAELRQEMLQYSSKLDEDWMISRGLGKIEEEYKEKTKECDNEAKLLDLEKSHSEDSSDTDSTALMRKPTKHEFREGLKLSLEVSSIGGNKNSDSSDDTYDSDISTQSAQCEQQENQQNSSGVGNGTIQLMKKVEEMKISNKPIRRYTLFMTRKCEEGVKVDETEKEQLSLMDRQWIEWMDKQEMKGNQVKTADQSQTIEEGGAGPSVSQPNVKQKQNKKGKERLKKVRTYLSDFFNPNARFNWKRLEEDD